LRFTDENNLIAHKKSPICCHAHSHEKPVMLRSWKFARRCEKYQTLNPVLIESNLSKHHEDSYRQKPSSEYNYVI